MSLTAQRKSTIHHKKLRGEHHRHGKQYVRTYAPYLPLLLAVIIGFYVNHAWTSHARVLGASTTITGQQLLDSTNQQRLQDHEAGLTTDPQLSSAAQAKANDMANLGYWSHTSPSGKTPWTFLQASGYSYASAGENLAYGFNDGPSVINGWMNSPEHRANLLNAAFEQVGFGVASAANYQGHGPSTIVVAMYGQPPSDQAVIGSSSLTTVPFHNVSRVQLLTGGLAPWSASLLLMLAMIGASVFLVRHSIAWHRVFVKGETFVLRHKYVDVMVALIVVAAIILTRAAGFVG